MIRRQEQARAAVRHVPDGDEQIDSEPEQHEGQQPVTQRSPTGPSIVPMGGRALCARSIRRFTVVHSDDCARGPGGTVSPRSAFGRLEQPQVAHAVEIVVQLALPLEPSPPDAVRLRADSCQTFASYWGVPQDPAAATATR